MIGLRSWTLLVLVVLGVGACGDDGGGATPGEMARQAQGDGGERIALTGAGATFPFPIYSRWFNEYAREHPVQINYQSMGSGAGIRQVIEGTVDFGASDAPMTEEELGRAPGTLNLPTVLGAVAVTYNLPGLNQPLRLSGDLLADIFRGQVPRWNDPRIAQLNPGVNLPDRAILVVHRSDGSGTTYVFTDYLTTVSAPWRQQIGTGTAVRWPGGIGAKGNEGVTGQVRQTEGAVGYVEQVFARQNDLPMAAIRNQTGQFVQPAIEATVAAASGVMDRVEQQGDFRISIVNAPDPAAYPIASWTYLLIPPHMDDCGRARALRDVVQWALSEGDAAARELHYAPLPDAVSTRVLERLGTVTCGPAREPLGGDA